MAIDMLYDKGVESFSISGGEVLLKEGFEDEDLISLLFLYRTGWQ